jgi:hypothetical protein
MPTDDSLSNFPDWIAERDLGNLAAAGADGSFPKPTRREILTHFAESMGGLAVASETDVASQDTTPRSRIDTSDSLAGTLDSEAERYLDEYLADCADDSLPTPTRREVVTEITEMMFAKVRPRVFRLTMRTNIERPNPIDPAFACQVLPEPPEPMSAQCEADDRALLESLSEPATARLEACYASEYDEQALLLSPTEMISDACENFLDQLESNRRSPLAKDRILACPAGQAALACLGLDRESSLLGEVLARHISAAPEDYADAIITAPLTIHTSADDVEETREECARLVRYNAAAFQVYAEMATGLRSQTIPEVAHIDFSDSGRPDGYLLPFYVPQDDESSRIPKLDHGRKLLWVYTIELMPKQHEAAWEAYKDMSAEPAHLFLVANTDRLSVDGTPSAGHGDNRPSWLKRAAERVRDHPLDDSDIHEGPFYQDRTWNPFISPE